MRVVPQEVFLHGSGRLPEYVFSVDICCSFEDGIIRVATGGADPVARVWGLDENLCTLVFRADLSGHSRGVNCVRFSPHRNLATASDDGQILLWRLSGSLASFGSNENSKESWTAFKKLNCLDEISHISWSPCGSQLAASLSREMGVVFDTISGRALQRLDGHSGRVDGIAWDPLGEFVASHSSDRSVRIFGRAKKKKSWYAKASFREVEGTCSGKIKDDIGRKGPKLFMSESHFTSDPTAHFFKRLEFSTDGSMLAVPGGILTQGSNWQFGLHLFSRQNFVTNAPPTASIPTADSPCVAVRFHPLMWTGETSEGFSIFAVVCVNFVAIYNSRQLRPLWLFTDLHCTALQDAAWTDDGQHLIVVSSDGFATVIKFEEGDLRGTPIAKVVERNTSMEPVETVDEDMNCSTPIRETKFDSAVDVEQVVPPNAEVKRRKITPVLIS